MPEFDAFGREVGEDTLSQWRQGSAALPPRPEPAPAAAVTAGARTPATPAPPRPSRRRRRRGGRVVVLLVLGWIGFNLIGNLADEVEDAARTITVPKLSPPGPVEQPTGLGPRSLLRPAELESALADIRRRDIGRIENLRVAPERINASLLTSRGTLVSVQVSADAQFQRFSESGPGFTATSTLPYDKLDPRVPQRLTTAAASRLGVRVSAINYLVPSRSGGKIVWGAYFKNGAIFLADARGRITRRIS